MKIHHLTWNESRHTVGIAEIDSQHRELIQRANRFSDAIAQIDQSSSVQESLDDLLLFSREHFAFEEQLMAKYGFPDLESHIQEHRRLSQQLNNLIMTNPSTPHHKKAPLVSAFLSDWVEQHILTDDTELGKFLVAKGLG